MFFLSKLLPVFVYPLGAAISLSVLGLALAWSGRRRLGTAALVVGLLVLWVASTPVFANWLVAELEGRFPPVGIKDMQRSDVAIVLGGAVGQPLPPRLSADLSDSGDRVVEAARLYKAGKVEHILVSGGNLPWQTAVAPEAELIGALLIEFGVPSEVIILESESRNTHENAVRTREIWRVRDFRTGLLITSAAHMPRALATFRRAGLPVMPAPTDFRVGYPIADSILDFLPDAMALERSTAGIKEWLGLTVYRLRGWA